MTVITDRVLRHVCRKARWNIGGRKRATWRFDAGERGGGTRGRETKASTRAGVTKYPDPEGEIKAGSFPRWATIEGGKGIRERRGKAGIWESIPPMSVPRDRCLSTDLFLSAAKIPIAASPIIGYFLASPSTKKLEKPTRLPFFRSSPLLFFLPFLLPSSANFSSADLSLPDALCLASSPIHFARVYSS